MKALKFIILLLCTSGAIAQARMDFGIQAGASYYLGEINFSKQFYSSNITGGVLLRYCFNPRYSARISAAYGKLSGNDADFSSQYQKLRNNKFSTSLYDITAQAEFNFLPYKVGDEKAYYSPYICAGISYFLLPSSGTPNNFGIPMGMGVKMNIKKNWAFGFEWVFKKTFTDDIDNINGSESFPESKKQTGFINNKDWYSMCCIFLTYMIFNEEMKCSAYGFK